MRRESIGTSGLLPHTAAQPERQRPPRVWFFLLIAALLPLFPVVAQSPIDDLGRKYKDPNDPKRTGPGQAAPWSVEGEPEDRPPRPKVRDPDRGPLREFMRDREKQPSGGVRCKILEVQELGRLYVEDVSGIAGNVPYWLQLPEEVKLLASDPRDFEGRKKLELEDLETGQLLIVTLKERTGEIIKVKVRQPKKIAKTSSSPT